MGGISWTSVLPFYPELPAGFRSCLPFLLASIVFHADYLRETLSPLHPVFHSQVFASGMVSRLQGKALTGNFKCRFTGLHATGVPAEMITAIQVSKLTGELAQLKTQMSCSLEAQRSEILNEVSTPIVSDLCDIAEGTPTQISKLPGSLTEELLKNFDVGGVQQVTRSDISALSESMIAQFKQILESRLTNLPANGSNPPPEPSSQPADASEARFRTFWWGSRFHMVPEGWKVPRPSLKLFYLLWHHGYESERIQPLKFLCRFDVSRPDWTQVTRCRRVIDELERVARGNGLEPGDSDFGSYDKTKLADIFDQAYERLLILLYGENEIYRGGEKAIGTLYNRVCEREKQ